MSDISVPVRITCTDVLARVLVLYVLQLRIYLYIPAIRYEYGHSTIGSLGTVRLRTPYGTVTPQYCRVTGFWVRLRTPYVTRTVTPQYCRVTGYVYVHRTVRSLHNKVTGFWVPFTYTVRYSYGHSTIGSLGSG